MKQQTKLQQTEIGEIPQEWEINTLGNVADILTGFPFKGEKYSNDGIKVVRGENVSIGFLRWDTEKRWNHSLDGLDNYYLRDLDIVIGMDGSRLGQNRARIKNSDLPLLLAQRVARLRAKDKLDQKFLYYVIFSDRFFNYIELAKTGTSIPHISSNQICDLILAIPPLSEQITIAKILSDLDSKIELNQQINKNLERIGQSIFNHWLIDFEFPNEKGKPYKSSGGEMVFSEELEKDVPVNCDVKPLDEVADFLNGLPLQKYPAETEDNSLPVIKIRELRQGITNSTDRCSNNLPEEYIINDGDILFSWSGSLDIVIWCNGKGGLNQHLFKVTSEEYPKWFYYFWVKHHVPKFQRIAEGKATTMGHIQRHHLTESPVISPPKEVLEQMNKIMIPLFERIINARVESKILAQIRDLLLPKLMSGKIRVTVEVET